MLSVSLVTAASGDEYLTGSIEPIVEMVAPDVWLDTALAEQSGLTEQAPIVSGLTMDTQTGQTLEVIGSGEISTGATMLEKGTGTIQTVSLSGSIVSGEILS
jgi:hypothetical protein